MSIQHRFYYKTARRPEALSSRGFVEKNARALLCMWVNDVFSSFTMSFSSVKCTCESLSLHLSKLSKCFEKCFWNPWNMNGFYLIPHEGRKLLNSPDNFEKLSIPHQFSFIYRRRRDTINGREKMTFAVRQWFYLILKKLSIPHQSFLFCWPLT